MGSRAYKTRLNVTPTQAARLEQLAGACRQVWNALLEQKLRAERLGELRSLTEIAGARQEFFNSGVHPWAEIPESTPRNQETGKVEPLLKLSRVDQCKYLPEFSKQQGWYGIYPSMTFQEVSRQQEAAWRVFFSLLKNSKTGGGDAFAKPPGWKGRRSPVHIPFMASGWKLEGLNRVTIMGVGRLRLRWGHLPDWALAVLKRESPEGGASLALGASITQDAGKNWWLNIVFNDAPEHEFESTGTIAGAVLKRGAFLVKTRILDNSGELTEITSAHPHAFEQVMERIAVLDQALDAKRAQYFALHNIEDTPEMRKRHSKAAWASKRSQKLLKDRGRLFAKSKRVRHNAVLTAARAVVNKVDTLILPDLPLQAAARVRGRAVNDAGHGKLYARVQQLAKGAGNRAVVFVESAFDAPEQVLEVGLQQLLDGSSRSTRLKRPKARKSQKAA